VEEVPLPERPLLVFNDEQRLAGQNEKALLVGFPVVHPYWRTRRKHAQEDADLQEVSIAFELATRRAVLAPKPGGVASIQDEPALPARRTPGLRLVERCLRDHVPIIRSAQPVEP
jgi:hypothetical protein